MALKLLFFALFAVSSGLAQNAPPREAAPSKFDGPAELPREFVKTSLADTEAPGKRILVHPEDNLQQAINQAACGDTLALESGAAFVGRFTLPAKDCDDSHWIVIRTSAPDSRLPPEGTRLTPCFAGVDSLPGRPPLRCASTENVLAKLVFDKTGSGPLVFDDGANHYRFIGLEITRAQTRSLVSNLISMASGARTDHLIFDRVWAHGTAQDETTRGVQLGSSRYVAVVDSFFTDFHCIAISGSCVDAQAIAGGSGNEPMGPFKIVGNFLEGAAETIIFGGGPATKTPADIEIRRNYMFKPMIWKNDRPDFVGGPDGRPFIVKNLFELKNAQRVLLEANVMENTWGGFSQTGFAVLLTPKNQSPNICPLCRVLDVTIRYNYIAHIASGFQIGNSRSDTGGAATDGGRYSIHDNVLLDMNDQTYHGHGTFAQVSADRPPLHDVSIDHVTAFPPNVLLNVGADVSQPRIANFVFTNNLVSTGRLEITTTGGKTNCAFGAPRLAPEEILKRCFSDYIVTHNAIVGARGGWPKGNLTLKNQADVGFLDANKERIQDIHLAPQSRLRGAGLDGKDIGADLGAIEKATAGVR